MRLAKYGGDVIQLVHKYLPPDHQLAKRPEIASRKTNLICEEPGRVLRHSYGPIQDFFI